MACERYWWHGSKEDQQRIVESAGTAVAGNGAVDQGRSPGMTGQRSTASCSFCRRHSVGGLAQGAGLRQWYDLPPPARLAGHLRQLNEHSTGEGDL